MKIFNLFFICLVGHLTLSAQQNIDTEKALLQALFLDVPIQAEVPEIMAYVNTQKNFVKKEDIYEVTYWKFRNHPFIELKHEEFYFTLAQNRLDWEEVAKIAIEIYPEKQTYAILKKEFNRLKKRIGKEFRQINKAKIGWSFSISKGERITYRSKKLSNPSTIKLAWLLGNCKRAYWLEIEYWEND